MNPSAPDASIWSRSRPRPAGDENHRNRWVERQEPPRHVEAERVRQLHVEKDHLGTKLHPGGHRGGTVVGLSDHVEALGLQQQSSEAAEGLMVVDDQSGRCHVSRVTLLVG
jgi:hypothetical protein